MEASVSSYVEDVTLAGAPGKAIAGKYALTSVIRQTQDSVLFRGHRVSDGEAIVVKLPSAEFPSAVELARLRHEYRIIDSLSLPCVVKALGLERAGNGVALLLEDVGTTSLAERIAGGEDQDLLAKLRTAAALARTLDAVHRAGVVHKDVKPEHFFFDGGADTVKLIDFGLATTLPREFKALAPATDLQGTLAYIAPEQTGRVNRAVDQRSDLYSLGVTLYELFTGRLPFDFEEPTQLVHSHIARSPQSPQDVAADIPNVVSAIIMRLLQKAPEDRYQSAAGLVRDLERCQTELENGGQVPEFELSVKHAADVLRVATKSYGRKAERKQLVEAFEQVRAGASELLLIGGSSGIGKSALVDELQSELVAGGYFAKGKFDYLDRSVPFAAIAHACRTLTQALLAESPAVLQEVKRTILDAVGENGQVLVDLVPEIEHVIGKQPPAPVLGAAESQRRFEVVFQRFLAAVTDKGRPLVVFLDDLQWADAASLCLVQLALTGGVKHLLVLGAYRDTEVDASHPLKQCVRDLEAADVRVSELSLGPLALEDVVQLLADSLQTEPEAVRPLGEVLIRKTQGNPFYVIQLLQELDRDGVLRFDRESAAWVWDLGAIERSVATENVVDLLLARMQRLDSVSRQVLQQAACIGHEFDTRTLARVAEKTPAEVNQTLQGALTEGLLVPLDSNYGLLDAETDRNSSLQARYRFLHDRVQHAAYSLVEEAQRWQVHLDIGRHLLSGNKDDAQTTPVFDIVDQLNRALTLIEDPAERIRLAELNLQAGTQAKRASAPRAAAGYFQAAVAAADGGWEEHHELMHSAQLGRSECELLIGNISTAIELFGEIEAHAIAATEKVEGRQLHIRALMILGKLPEACALTVDTLRLLGLEVPDADDKPALGEAVGAKFGALQELRGGREVQSFADLESLTDPHQLAILSTLAEGIPAAYQSNQELNALLVLEGTLLTLKQGTAPLSPFFYAQYGVAHAVVTGDFKTAFEFGQLAIALSERPQHRSTVSMVHFLNAGFLAPWRRHISVSYDSFRAAFTLGIETGDLLYAQYAIALECNAMVLNGAPLNEVSQRLEVAFDLVARTKDVLIQMFLELAQRTVEELTGSEPAAAFDREQFEKTAPPPIIAAYGPIRAMTCFLVGNFRASLHAAEAFPPLPPTVFCSDHALFKGLALSALAAQATDEQRSELLEQLPPIVEKLEQWAASAPDNHTHRAALLQAELTWLRGEHQDALSLYDRAADHAKAGGYLLHQGVACERCARMLLGLGRQRAAKPYLTEAHWAFSRWGATAKCAALLDEFSSLIGAQPMAPVSSLMNSRGSTRQGRTLHVNSIDFASAVEATAAIAGELVLERALEGLTRVLIENSGARRAALLLSEDDGMMLQALGQIEPDRVEVGQRTPLEATTTIPQSIVQYVARTQGACVLDCAIEDARFARDPYVAQNKVQSVLCAPLMHRARLTGVLYLENNNSRGVFDPERVRLLQFLAAQAATAVENARLYGEVSAAEAQLRSVNETLEAQVAERTEQLRKTVDELWSEMDLAKKIQTVLLPTTEQLGDYQVAGAMTPADSVGGDYYDVVETNYHDWVLLGDVSGHGASAGLIMMMVQTAVRSVIFASGADASLTPEQLLTKVNGAVMTNLTRVGKGQYMTLTALRLEGNTIRFSGLHQDILVYRSEQRVVERVETQGVWIGILDDIGGLLNDLTIELNPGDILLLFTDGATELQLPEKKRMLGTDGLAERFLAAIKSSSAPKAIVKSLMGSLARERLDDDITLFAMRYAPGEAPAEESAD